MNFIIEIIDQAIYLFKYSIYNYSWLVLANRNTLNWQEDIMVGLKIVLESLYLKYKKAWLELTLVENFEQEI